jgi:hypothetical protein
VLTAGGRISSCGAKTLSFTGKRRETRVESTCLLRARPHLCSQETLPSILSGGRRALRSSCRVMDPEEADYFLVPIWVSSAMWQMNWGFRDLLGTGTRTVAECAAYLRATWPYFDRHGGKDHLWVFGHDQGAWRIRARVPAISTGIFLSPFGAGPAQRGGHLTGHDIVVPPVLYQSVALGLLNHAGRRKKPLQNLAFFQGKLNLHIPYESRAHTVHARATASVESFHCGVCAVCGIGTSTPSASDRYARARPCNLPYACVCATCDLAHACPCATDDLPHACTQGLFKAHRTTPRIVIKEGHEANREDYFENMCGSKYAPAFAISRMHAHVRRMVSRMHAHVRLLVSRMHARRFCVVASGFGFSTRALEAATAGCVPLLMQDGVEQFFEDILPWARFSLRMNNSLGAIGSLPQKLAAVPEDTVRALRSTLYCAWPRLLWLDSASTSTPLPDAERLLKFDAFEMIMWTLRKRLRGDVGSRGSHSARTRHCECALFSLWRVH